MVETPPPCEKGFIVMDWFSHMPEFLKEVAPYIADGRLKSRETVVEGLENVGKMVVKMQ